MSRHSPALTAYTLTSAVGRGVGAHIDALLSGRGGLRPMDLDGVDLETWIGRVDGVEETRLAPALRDYACRNNCLAALALDTDGFAARVRAAAHRYGASRVGLFIGTSTSGVREAELAYVRSDPESGRLPADFRYDTTQSMYSIGGFVREYLGLAGPAEVISTACSSSAKAFGVAHRFLRAGLCDAAVVGGVDSLCQMTLYGFNSLQLVSTHPCRPADRDRDGLSIGEAAGFALLETDGVPDAIRLLGCGESSDAWHMSSPRPDGAGAENAIAAALEQAALAACDIDYVNLHGTATQANDLAEDAAVYAVFGDAMPVSSTKGYTGHTLGAAGIVEALLACIAIEENFVPGSLNTAHVDPRMRISIQRATERRAVRTAMTNSFGFGGSNVSLIFGRAG